MNFLRLIATSLLELLKAVTYKWVLAIINSIKQLINFINAYLRWKKLPHHEQKTGTRGCGKIDHPAFHRADPLIYSQYYLQSLGLATTWDNPVIVLKKNGAVVSETSLQPNTEYEIEARIWNNSYEAPIAGMPVNFSFLSFGAGTTKTPIGSDTIDIGVKGGPGHPAYAKTKWITPPAGHYCIQVDFNLDDDLNPANNLGQNNVDVQTAQSPAIFQFDIQNSLRKPDNFSFEVDTYTIPEPAACKTKIETKKTNDEKWKEIKALHNKLNFPVPAGWNVIFSPNDATLQPGQSMTIQTSIEPPPGFLGNQIFNVHAIGRSGKEIGGVTLTVLKS